MQQSQKNKSFGQPVIATTLPSGSKTFILRVSSLMQKLRAEVRAMDDCSRCKYIDFAFSSTLAISVMKNANDSIFVLSVPCRHQTFDGPSLIDALLLHLEVKKVAALFQTREEVKRRANS